MEATLGNTLQLWGEARYALDHAIQNYLDRTVALQSDLQSYSHSSGSTPVQDTLPKAWLDDIQVPANYSKLARAQAHLSRIRNSFLSINTLPLEILLRIFRFSAFHSFHTRYNTPLPNPFQKDDRNDLVVLTHICTHWRTVLLNTQTFWSRFELNTKENLAIAGERARAYLDRAPDVPLSFYIEEHPMHELCSVEDSLITEHLEARLDRLARIALINFRDPHTARDIILFWMRNGKPGTLRTLTIRMDTDYWYDEVVDTRSLSVTRERADLFLAPIRVLYLNRWRFDWDSPVYHNLVVLRIGGFSEEFSPRIHEMLAILSACPQLHTLQLFTMSIRPSDLRGFEPVYLNELDNLSLIDVSSKSSSLLLPTISPQSPNLTFRVTLPQTDEEIGFDSIRLFLSHNNVTRLFIQEWVDVGSYNLSWYLSAAPNLHTLIIDVNEAPGDRCLSGLTRLDESKGIHVPLCPQLHTLYLLEGTFSTTVVQQVVETHHIRKLRFLGCDIKPSEDGLQCRLKPFVEDVRFEERVYSAESVDWYHLMD